MPHIHTKPGEHDHTASAFIVRTDGNEPRILLHLHKKLHRYIQFGGHIEINENPWQAITHELLEESGYEMSQLKILQPVQRMALISGNKLHPVPIYHATHPIDTFDLENPHLHTDVAYAFVSTEEPKQPISDNESGQISEFTRNKLLALQDDQTLEPIREACLFVFDVCLKEWERVDPKVFD